MRTWKKELAAVIVILAMVWFFSGGGLIEAVGSIAVIFTFCHSQVAFRLEEQHRDNLEQPDGSINVHTVDCFRWQSRYFCFKELCWLLYFSALGAYSALVGVFVFLAYPYWRKLHRRKVPDRVHHH